MRALNAREQAAFIRINWPTFRCVVSESQLLCTGSLRPSSLGDEYKVRVEYRPWRSPKIRVTSPSLVSRSAEEAIPHRYKDGSLCLYCPGMREWTADARLDLTIIPWIVLWLFFYERWLEGDPWRGGGIEHPQGKPEPADEDHRRSTESKSESAGRSH